MLLLSFLLMASQIALVCITIILLGTAHKKLSSSLSFINQETIPQTWLQSIEAIPQLKFLLFIMFWFISSWQKLASKPMSISVGLSWLFLFLFDFSLMQCIMNEISFLQPLQSSAPRLFFLLFPFKREHVSKWYQPNPASQVTVRLSKNPNTGYRQGYLAEKKGTKSRLKSQRYTG